MTVTDITLDDVILEGFVLDYVKRIAEDKAAWNQSSKIKHDDEFTVKTKDGRNYIKIVLSSTGHTSVHSFVVRRATKGFAVGDILKAASWKAPATNFSRGSVYNLDDVRIRWTGAI